MRGQSLEPDKKIDPRSVPLAGSAVQPGLNLPPAPRSISAHTNRSYTEIASEVRASLPVSGDEFFKSVGFKELPRSDPNTVIKEFTFSLPAEENNPEIGIKYFAQNSNRQHYSDKYTSMVYTEGLQMFGSSEATISVDRIDGRDHYTVKMHDNFVGGMRFKTDRGSFLVLTDGAIKFAPPGQEHLLGQRPKPTPAPLPPPPLEVAAKPPEPSLPPAPPGKSVEGPDGTPGETVISEGIERVAGKSGDADPSVGKEPKPAGAKDPTLPPEGDARTAPPKVITLTVPKTVETPDPSDPGRGEVPAAEQPASGKIANGPDVPEGSRSTPTRSDVFGTVPDPGPPKQSTITARSQNPLPLKPTDLVEQRHGINPEPARGRALNWSLGPRETGESQKPKVDPQLQQQADRLQKKLQQLLAQGLDSFRQLQQQYEKELAQSSSKPEETPSEGPFELLVPGPNGTVPQEKLVEAPPRPESGPSGKELSSEVKTELVDGKPAGSTTAEKEEKSSGPVAPPALARDKTPSAEETKLPPAPPEAVSVVTKPVQVETLKLDESAKPLPVKPVRPVELVEAAPKPAPEKAKSEPKPAPKPAGPTAEQREEYAEHQLRLKKAGELRELLESIDRQNQQTPFHKYLKFVPFTTARLEMETRAQKIRDLESFLGIPDELRIPKSTFFSPSTQDSRRALKYYLTGLEAGENKWIFDHRSWAPPATSPATPPKPAPTYRRGSY